MNSYSSISIANLKKDPIMREQIHIPENKIRFNIGLIYNNTINHQVKIKDTKKTIFPVSGSFSSDRVYQTMMQFKKADSLIDPFHKEHFHKKVDFQIKYTEEMLRAKNMMIKKKLV